ncbi:MAG: sigma-70 family RNA polymerase sigma factor [Clostridia bacterium]|nr:sigma-70 family RNA polymerase sigma factor [Clostridia bacterium]
MDDKRIIDLFFARDEACLREVTKKYGKLIMHIAENFLSRREDAEECLNDVLLELWNRIPPETPGDLRAYIAAIIRSRAIDKLRAESAGKRGGNVLIVSDELLSDLPDGTTLSEKYESTLAGEVVNRFLESQEKSDRAVFVMRYFLMESIKEISARTGFSEGKIKMLLMRMRRRLEEELRKEGILL